jgi:hypothetical protein
MHERQLQALGARFVRNVNAIVQRHPAWRGIQHGLPFGGDGEAPFEDLVVYWGSRQVFRNIAPSALRRRLENAVIAALSDLDRSAEIAQRLANELETPMSCDILLPLYGIDSRGMSLLLSDDIVVTYIDPEHFDDTVTAAYIRAVVARGDTAEHARRIADFVRPSIAGRTVLKIRATGDEDSALYAAKQRANLVVDVLQFIAALTDRADDFRFYIDWKTSLASGWQTSAIIPRQGPVRITNPGQRIGPLTSWRPAGTRLYELARLGGFDIATLPLKNNPTLHEERIARSVRAFAAAERAALTDEKKQNYVSIFDIFFSVPGADDTARNIREGVAFALWGTEQQHDGFRLALARFIERVYRSRSETTHEFRIGEFEAPDLAQLRTVALSFIEGIATREPFVDRQKADIRDWLDECPESLGRERYEAYNAMSRIKLELRNP